jgi:hypothetical protein
LVNWIDAEFQALAWLAARNRAATCRIGYSIHRFQVSANRTGKRAMGRDGTGSTIPGNAPLHPPHIPQRDENRKWEQGVTGNPLEAGLVVLKALGLFRECLHGFTIRVSCTRCFSWCKHQVQFLGSVSEGVFFTHLFASTRRYFKGMDGHSPSRLHAHDHRVALVKKNRRTSPAYLSPGTSCASKNSFIIFIYQCLSVSICGYLQ